MKKKLIVLAGLVLASAPVMALAQVTVNNGNTSTCQDIKVGTTAGNPTIVTILCQIGSILNTVVPVLIALGVVYFVYGVITYVISSDEEAKKAGRNRIIFGIIGLAVIVGVWGLVGIVTNTFGLDNSGTINLPTIQ